MLTKRLLDREPEDVPPSRTHLFAAIRSRIGQGLRDRYELKKDLPDSLRRLADRLEEGESGHQRWH
jgi:hypothetical protein